MDTIRWGIIGCGNVTEVKSGPAFNKVDNSKLVAVMRRNAEKARDYALRHQVPRWYADAYELIGDPEVNAVYVATPPSSHEEYAIAALRAGKHVYLEKPMSMDAASADRITKVADELGGRLSVAHYRRRLPLFLKIKELLHNQAIGEVRLVNLKLYQQLEKKNFAPGPGNWRLVPGISGGGIFHDLAPHQLDLMYYYFGRPVLVQGVSFNQGSHYEADDVVTGFARFANNILFNGLWSFGLSEIDDTDSCEIIGEKGSLHFSIFNMDRVEIMVDGQSTRISFEPVAHVQQPMIESVVQYFLGKSDNPCAGNDGVEVMRMIDAMTGKSH